ncbi:MAG TPA: sialidase family protein [Micromonosporaceae bacterium]|nr:sialidase family protein [Micromonosporaceae bacterium]
MDAAYLSRRSLLAGGAAAVAAPWFAGGPAAAAAPPYRWSNVEIVGGGFVPGIVFNQSEPGLVYARTDIGGAYRRDPRTQRWIPLLDWVDYAHWGYTGVASVATDAVDPDRVYLAVGTYTTTWDKNNAAILRSTDRGKNWKISPLPFKLGANMPGRGMGERLAIDPNRNRILYLGAPSGNGLWRSVDSGKTWSRVTSFPNPGNFVPDPNDVGGYSGDNQGVLWVTFDPRTGNRRQPTSTIYVGVADLANPVYRSTDAGQTWHPLPGAPTGYLPHKGLFDHQGGYLYLATSNGAGPFDGSKGEVWKLNTATGAWTDISPVPSASADNTFGYSGLTIDRQRPDTLMVATQIQWWPDVVFFRSTDGGATWTRAWEYVGEYPNRVNRYTIDVSDAPWLTWGNTPAPPEQAPKLGWMTESVEIDPFNSDHLLYGTGATIYGTDNLTAWDNGGTVRIEVHARGLEETAVLDLISPPEGAHLVSAVGDIGGFTHWDFANPGMMHQNPVVTTGTSLDYAELAPAVIARVGNREAGSKHMGISTDQGRTWTAAGAEPAGITQGGTIAVSADGRRVVWAPGDAAVHVSTDNGATWTPSVGVPTGAYVRSDRVDPNLFYAVAAGVFHVSTDGGATFTATGATGLPPLGAVRFRAVPGRRGDIWFAGGSDEAPATVYGLWRSTDAGQSFTRVTTVQTAQAVGFGKSAPGQSYPALYISAQVDGVQGLFRSDNIGRTWLRINDDRHQYAWTGAAVTGDPRVYGRVYVGTNGRGIILGESRGRQ